MSAYLGYVAVPYALHRLLAPESRFAAREEAIVGALERRVVASPIAQHALGGQPAR